MKVKKATEHHITPLEYEWLERRKEWERPLMITRIVYILIEIFYNVHLINLSTTVTTTVSDLDQIVTVGHWLSAVGITLLLAPAVFKFLLFIPGLVVLGVLAVGIKSGITTAVDHAIDAIDEFAYEAYYINLYRMGVIAGKIDSSLIPDGMDIDSMDGKLFLVNIYAALFIDEELITKMKAKALPAAAEVAFKKKRDEFDQFVAAAREMTTKFSDAHKQLNSPVDSAGKEIEKAWSNADKKFDEAMGKMRTSYDQYVQKTEKAYKRYVDYASNPKERLRFKSAPELLRGSQWKKEKEDLRSYNRRLALYDKTMRQIFPGVDEHIPLDEWCPDIHALCPDDLAERNIRKYGKLSIEREAGISMGLTYQQYLSRRSVKERFAQTSGLKIPTGFTFTRKEFKKIYLSSIQGKYDRSLSKIDNKAKELFGVSNPDHYSSWINLVPRSSKIKQAISELMPEPFTGKERFVMLKLVALKDMSAQSIRDGVYFPMLAREAEKLLYGKRDFQKDPEAIERGRDALVALVAPALGVTLSMLSLLLNVIGALVAAMKSRLSPGKRPFAWGVLALLAFAVPAVAGGSGILSAITDHLDSYLLVQIHMHFVNITVFYESLLELIYAAAN